MDNTLILTKKEFENLINNKIVFIIIIIYLFFITTTIFDYYAELSQNVTTFDNLAMDILLGIWFVLTEYGSWVGIVIGFSLISNERTNNALNTLIIKPLYRDTIINGKFLGALGFIGCLFGFTITIFISALLIVSGSSIAPVLQNIMERIPFIFALSVINVMIFIVFSMLISLIVRDQAFALISCVIIKTILNMIPNVNVTGNIYYLLTNDISIKDDQIIRFISELSPQGISLVLTNSNFFNPSISLWASINSMGFEIARLFLYMIILIVLSYIVFIRSDIA